VSRFIYLHGFASGPSSRKARFFAERFAELGIGLEIPDLAQGDFAQLTITGQLGVLERLAGDESVSLIGSSMGGYLAALYAQRHPDIPRLVLLAPAFRFVPRWVERLGPEAEQWRRTGAMQVFHYGENRNCALSYKLLEDAVDYPDFPDFRQPALIFHGVHDDVVPPAFSEEFAATHPNAHLEILDSGHELINVLDYMARKVLPFLLGRQL
jgi:hypothetical protein